MSRIIEIVLFLTPFFGLLAWRLLFPAPSPPGWLMWGLGGFVFLMLAALFWVRHIDVSDANQAYVPAALHENQIVPAHPAAPP